MEIRIRTLGAGREVGRSCIVVKIKNYKIMLDCGVHMGYNDERKFPNFSHLLNKKSRTHTQHTTLSPQHTNNITSLLTTTNTVTTTTTNNIFKHVEDKDNDYSSCVDLLIISHFHLDHCGALPYFTELLGYNGPILCTHPTKSILPLTLEDFRKIMSDYIGQKSLLLPEQIENCIRKITTIEVNETKTFHNKIKVTCFYAGHVLGAAMFLIDVDGYTVAYTGDYNTITDRHLYGAYMPKLYPDVLITETTYGDKVRETKRVREREFLRKIQETIDKGGKVLIPIFALGRAQELCIVLDTYWKRTNCQVPIYFVGPMAKKANFYYQLFQNWMNSTVKNLFTTNNVFEFKFVKQGDKSLMKANMPMVIFATPGMLHGGLSLNIFKEVAPDRRNCVIIPGYCSVGTVGYKLLKGEKCIEIDSTKVEVKCEVHYMSFSAHADAKGLLQLIKNVEPKNVMLVHGDAAIMEQFKRTCESNLINMKGVAVYNVVNPDNYERVKFKGESYYHVKISKDVLSIIRCLYSIKDNTEKSVGVKGVWIKNGIINVLKGEVFKVRNVKVKIRNRITFDCGGECIEVFKEFLNAYFKREWRFYKELVGNGKYCNVEYDDNKNKVKFEFIRESAVFDSEVRYFKMMKVVKVFERFNKVMKERKKEEGEGEGEVKVKKVKKKEVIRIGMVIDDDDEEEQVDAVMNKQQQQQQHTTDDNGDVDMK